MSDVNDRSEKVPAPKIVIVGSINMDLVIRCGQLPAPGETVMANSASEVCGGKGANQAVAAANAGGEVSMIGRIGDDAFAGRLRDNLRAHQIDDSDVLATKDCSSGVAVVAVEDSGQNSILVVPGANAKLTPGDVQKAAAKIEAADVLLVQLEVPIETVIQAIKLAKANDVRVILDPAPTPAQWSPGDWPAELLQVDVLCPNEHEAAAMMQMMVSSDEETRDCAKRLHDAGCRHVIITRGDRGALHFDGQQFADFPAHPITAVDSTAAGDAFAGALAAEWAASGNAGNTVSANLDQAITFAGAAGAMAASRAGAQPSIPTRAEIETMLNKSR